MQFTAEMIASYLGGEIEGDKNVSVSDFAKIEEGRPGTLSFLANPKYEHYIYQTQSSIVIVRRDFAAQGVVKTTLIRVDDAYAAFARLLRLYAEQMPRRKGISEKASIAAGVNMGEECYVGDFTVIEEDVCMGDRCVVYPHSYIGKGVKMGNGCTIYAGARIYEGCVLGDNVSVHSGSVIGADGFGFAPDADGTYSKIPQLGNVILEDNVDIGANTCIDRATMGATIIREGVKLDNLVQVGHNVVIGKNTVAAAQFGVAGSSKVGENCMFGGQVGIAGHLTVGDNVRAGSQSGISNDVASDNTVMGTPSMTGLKFHRSHAIFRNLPELSLKVSKLEKAVNELSRK